MQDEHPQRGRLGEARADAQRHAAAVPARRRGDDPDQPSVQESSALAIANAGGVHLLIQCLGTPTDEILQEKAASALWNLSTVPSIKTQIRKAGSIPFLLSVLEFSSFVPAIENVLGTLLSLAETQENRFAIAEAGAVGLLIRQLESQHRAVVEKAAGVIWNLAHEDSVRTTIRQLGGLKPLIDLLRHTDPLIRFNTVGAFPLLTEQLENRTEAFDLGVIPPLVTILANDTNHVVLQNAAQSVGNIADGNSQYQNAIRESQGLLRLVELFNKWSQSDSAVQDTDSSRQDLLAKVCFACWLICENNEVNQKAFRDAGGMPALVRMLDHKYDAVLLEMAAGCMCALCENFDSNKVAVRECEGLRPLIELLEYGAAGSAEVSATRALDVQLNAAKALAQLAENPENKGLIREQGGLDKLVKLLSPTSEKR